MELPNVYDSEKRYIFSNWTGTDFEGMWGGITTLVKTGESIEVPEYKAYHFTKHLVDREMQSSRRVAVDSPEARKPLEEKSMVEITAGVDSLALASLKKQIKEEVLKESGEMTNSHVSLVQQTPLTNEFADIQEEEKKVGRPRKVK